MSCGTLVPAAAFSFSLTRLLRALAGLSSPVQLRITSAYAGPQPQKACSLVWALSLSLAATQKIDVSFSSFRYLDVSVPGVPSCVTMCSSRGDWALPQPGFPIQKSRDQSLLAAPPGLSQLATSFVGARCHWHPPCALVRLISIILRPIFFFRFR